MKTASIVLLLPLAACSMESNLGNRASDHELDEPVDAWTYAPDANPPHTFVWWAPRLSVGPEQACNPWTLADSAAADPVLSAVELTLSAAAGEQMTYAQSGAELTPWIPESMLVEAVVRLVDGDAGVRFRYHGWTDGLTIADGTLTTDGGTAVSLATTDADHVYRLEVDPWTGWVIIRVDQTIVAEEAADNIDLGETASIELGQLEPGTSVWTQIAHDVHTITECPLP